MTEMWPTCLFPLLALSPAGAGVAVGVLNDILDTIDTNNDDTKFSKLAVEVTEKLFHKIAKQVSDY